MLQAPFARVIAAIATPFRSDLSVDFEQLVAHANWLLENGCDGLVLFGTTGEAVSLTVAERKVALECLIRSGFGANNIVVGTGCCAIPDTVELTKHVGEAGCAGALILPPYFYKNLGDGGIADCIDRVIAACGSSLPPLYLYHIPQVAGAGYRPDLVARLIARHGRRIRGYKDSSGNWSHTAEIVARFPGLDVYVGSESMLLAALRAGAAGCISAGVNVQPLAVRKAADHWQSGDADSLHLKIDTVRRALEKSSPLIPAVKGVLAAIHRHDGWRAVRPPLQQISATASDALLSELRGLSLAGV